MPRARRYLAVALITVLAVVAVLYAGAWFYLPTFVASRKGEIEVLLSRLAQQPVRFEGIEPYWDGLNPGVRVSGAGVYAEDGTPSIRIGEARASIALAPLVIGKIEINRVVLVRPVLAVARSADGRIGIVGIRRRENTGGMPGWLLQPPRIIVHDAEMRWMDALEPDKTLVLSSVEIRVRNTGERHRLTVSADLPDVMCSECSAAFDITGNPLAGSWEGEISVRTRGLDVAVLPRIIRERLPEELRGQFDLRLWSEWRDGRLQRVRGDAAVRGVRFPLGVERKPLALREAAAEVSWYMREDGGWRLDLIDAKVALTRAAWAPGRIRLTRGPAEVSFQMKRAELDDIGAFAAAYQSQHRVIAQLVELHPSGTVEDLDVRMHGPLEAPTDFSIRAHLIDLGIAARDRFPGVRGMSGKVSLEEDRGEIDLDATNFALHLPNVFRGNIETRRASAQLRWRKTATAWQIDAENLRLKSDDASGTGNVSLELPHDRAVSPVLRLRIDVQDGNIANAHRYFPIHHLPPRVLEWAESSFVGGRVVSGHVIYEGAIRNFPFADGNGRFEVRGRARNVSYRYLRGWTPITQADAEVAVDGANVRVTGNGRIGALQARGVKVDVTRSEGLPGRLVQVHGKLEGPVAETVRVLRDVDSPRAEGWQPLINAIGQADGTGALDLEVRVPLGRDEEPSFLASYRFKDATLRQASGAGLERAEGFVRFGESGLREASVRGQFFGGPAVLAAAYHGGELRVHANGKMRVQELLRGQRAVAERLSGDSDWSLAWQQSSGGSRLQLEADLRAVRSRLPAPFEKSDATTPAKLTVTTEYSDANTVTLAVNASPMLQGRLAFRREPGWQLQRGRLEIGRIAARPLPQSGFEVNLGAETLDVDRWLALFSGGTSSSEPVLPYVTALTADIRKLQVANRQWGRLFAHVVRRGPEWRAVLDGDALAGEANIALARDEAPRLRFDLSYLRLPELGDGTDALKDGADPRGLPKIDLHARSFEYKQRRFGELQFAAAPHASGWRIARLSLSRPEMTLTVNGDWRTSNERQFTEVNLEFNTNNMGTTLDAVGVPGQMADGKVGLKANLTWPGSPMRPTIAGIDGKVEISAEKGRFLKFDPGAARLFGLLDLRSIGRYLTFDFSPAFGKGFTFDSIDGTIAVEHGDARTHDLVIKGPSLGLGINGRVGLAAEDYDLILEASPKFSTSLTLTSWGLLGPQAAAAVLAIQRLFKRQIEQGTRVTYIVKGPWSNPSITKLGKPAPTTPEPTDVPIR